jgi:aspartyl/asparaginyl beta-hydroxylase (cupin superfamily)
MFDLNSTSIFIGLIVIVFIICVTLLIFAPKSINYYPIETYPILESIYENNKSIINKDFDDIENDTDWLDWPDMTYVSGTCKIFPMYIFSTLSKKRKQKCSKTYKLIKNMPNIKTCAFIKIDKKSKLNKQTECKELANSTLRCLYILKSVSHAPIETCGIWVNGESKKLISNKIIIFDSSKEHSIYNGTDYPLYALMIDIKRPEKIANGISQREYSNELYNFVCKLTND